MRLLVVDDEPRLAEGLKRGLEAEGFAVDVAHTGTDGLWLAREQQYAAILLDIMLPGMNGIDVCRTITKDEVTRTIPIIMVTVKNELASKLSSYIAGARRFISKLDGMDGLVSEVEKVLK